MVIAIYGLYRCYYWRKKYLFEKRYYEIGLSILHILSDYSAILLFNKHIEIINDLLLPYLRLRDLTAEDLFKSKSRVEPIFKAYENINWGIVNKTDKEYKKQLQEYHELIDEFVGL